jgi:hypothetical protein
MLKKYRLLLSAITLIHLAPILTMCCDETFAFPEKTESISLIKTDLASRSTGISTDTMTFDKASFELWIEQTPNDSLFAPLNTRFIASLGLLNSANATSCDRDYSYLLEFLSSIEITALYTISGYSRGDNLNQLFRSSYDNQQDIDHLLSSKRTNLRLKMPVILAEDSIGFVVRATLSDGRILKDSTSVVWSK